MNYKNKLIIGIVLGIILVSGITYAILTWTSTRINLSITTECFTIDYTKGGDITGSLKLLNEEDLITNDNKFTIKNGVGISSVNIGINSNCNIEGYGRLLLNVTSISDAFTTGSSVGSLKYVVLKNTSSITNPSEVSVTSLLNQSFDIEESGSITSSGTINILTKQLSNTEIYKYLIVIYIDNNIAGNDVIGATFEANISADATQGKAPLETVAKYITKLYTNAEKTTVTNNSITYNTAPSVGLMNDRLGSSGTDINGGNIRYYGAEPNNYIYFNCSDYSNQSSSTCETWRIIGVLDGKVKIMRNEVIGDYSWNSAADSTDSSTSLSNNNENANIVSLLVNEAINYKTIFLVLDLPKANNNWSQSSLMKLLNPGYESKTIGGSLYYNSGSGSCYRGPYNATTTCDFTSTGIKNDTTKNLISDTLYYLGGWNSESVYSDQFYNYERGTTVYTGRPTSWTGKIALAYPSDYGYAADLGSCTVQLGSYNDSTCTSANWMKNIITNNGNSAGWLLTPLSGISSGAWNVGSSGVVGYSDTDNVSGVVPVLYLGSELGIESGTGTNSDPYRLSVS